MKKIVVILMVLVAGAAFAQSNMDLANAAFDRGWTALSQGNYDLAIREFTEAIRLLPNAADGAYYWRGFAYYEKKTGIAPSRTFPS